MSTTKEPGIRTGGKGPDPEAVELSSKNQGGARPEKEDRSRGPHQGRGQDRDQFHEGLMAAHGQTALWQRVARMECIRLCVHDLDFYMREITVFFQRGTGGLSGVIGFRLSAERRR
jgi:hypothetical protein